MGNLIVKVVLVLTIIFAGSGMAYSVIAIGSIVADEIKQPRKKKEFRKLSNYIFEW